jgi:hypothetical protein
MKKFNLIAGFGGAIVITLLNESLKNEVQKAPRLDLLGEEAVQKSMAFFGTKVENKDTLYKSSLSADLVSNTIYYGMIGGEGKELWGKAAIAGLTAGIGGVFLPEKIGLNEQTVTKSFTTKLMTVGYYMIGALTTAAILQVMNKK